MYSPRRRECVKEEENPGEWREEFRPRVVAVQPAQVDPSRLEQVGRQRETSSRR